MQRALALLELVLSLPPLPVEPGEPAEPFELLPPEGSSGENGLLAPPELCWSDPGAMPPPQAHSRRRRRIEVERMAGTASKRRAAGETP